VEGVVLLRRGTCARKVDGQNWLELLSRQDARTSRAETGVFIAVLGIGMGFLMHTTMLIAQNSVEREDFGVASSAATFFGSIGGSFGVPLFSAVFNQRLAAEVATRLGAAGERLTAGRARVDPATLKQLLAPIRAGFLQVLAAATSNVFVWAVVFAGLIPVLSALRRHIRLRGSNPPDVAPTAASRSDLDAPTHVMVMWRDDPKVSTSERYEWLRAMDVVRTVTWFVSPGQA
jgi:hypothetical protein